MHSDAFRAAVEREDVSALEAALGPDVVFRSPAVFRPYEGREAVLALLSAVFPVLEGFHYTDQVETGDTAVLAFSAHVGDRDVDGIDLLRFDAEGKVRELTVYVRPLSGLQQLAETMTARMGRPSAG
jgi:ketosteroid isomerase-like protein